jgi:NAD(P)-dependent dehydrogenase (short-subunit alcohol dehydrogenase family)
MGRLDGKVAIVTAAASGIGRATAQVMAREGARVIVADVDGNGAGAVVESIRSAGGNAWARTFDAFSAESIAALIHWTRDTCGAVHVLHNNVGATDPTKDLAVADLDLDCWDRTMALCLKSMVVGCKYALPIMVAQGGGSIVNTSSQSGLSGDLGFTAYGAAKAGVISLTQHVATQYGARGIRCNAIAPGLTMTAAVERVLPPPMQQIFIRQNLLPRAATPEDIAHVVSFLASDEAAFITGQVISVDGGLRAHLPTTADMAALFAGSA